MKLWARPYGVRAENRWIRVHGRRIRLLVIQRKDRVPGIKVPGVLWMHGGGYATGMPEMAYMTRAIDLVTRCGAVLVCPAYTLSWKAPYPAALQDCHGALRYMKDHAEDLGIREDQIMVGGESAGGGLAAALCLYARDHGTVNIAFQMPLYPMLDCYDTPSSRDNHEKVWNTRRNHMAWRLYLRGRKDRVRVPAYASPARNTDFRGLPPCYTFVGDIEPFFAETLAYADNLQKAGVEARADVYPGFYHACDIMESGSQAVREAADTFVLAFIEACGKYHAPQKTEPGA